MDDQLHQPQKYPRKKSENDSVSSSASANVGQHVDNKSDATKSVPTTEKSSPTFKSEELEALLDGKLVKVRVRIESSQYQMDVSRDSFVGFDGNKFYCQVCGGFGEIVCCDGCPRVYHPDCISSTHPSRLALDRDDDPWYCPECLETVAGTSSPNAPPIPGNFSGEEFLPTDRRETGSHFCINCREERSDLNLEQCQSCHNMVHVPSCAAADTDSPRGVCHPCQSVTARAVGGDVHGGLKRKKGESSDLTGIDDSTFPRVEAMKATPPGPLQKKRKKETTSSSKKKKKHKAQKTASSSPAPLDAAPSSTLSESAAVAADTLALFQTRSSHGFAQATPAFYFYLSENRWKIERSLARNHRFFNRLPKGEARNELVAKEAAIWWTKLRPADHRRYMNMSMREFESQIIEWKEDKNLHEMGLGEVEEVRDPLDESVDDNNLILEKHETLFLSTSVGSKPFNPEADQNYNRVLLDLLHDTRFHPLPLFGSHKGEADEEVSGNKTSSKVTIPYFEVHGPLSTSVGDECLGCSRGWLHYCPVLQRRVPAVEHRAKMQPPISSLLATRVGMGLRPQIEQEEDINAAPSEIYSWRLSDEQKELMRLPELPSSSLDHPSDRLDDVTRFIEGTIAMKVPEPPRPLPTDSSNRSHSAPKLSVNHVFKCGRCRTIIYNDTGCVQCRRAQLVINTTKKSSSQPDRGSLSGRHLRVRTVMLGRVAVKDGMEEKQSEGDVAVSNAMLGMRWTPNAILPRAPAVVPRPKIDLAPGTSPLHVTPRIESIVGDESGGGRVASEDASDLSHNGGQDASMTSRPQRSSRSTFTYSEGGEQEREKIARENRRKTEELQKKSLSIACCGILLALRRRDPLLLFAEPATAEGYSVIVQHPIDLGKIRQNVLAEKYSSLGGFVSDVRLLCENAFTFNPAMSIYSKTAKELYHLINSMHKRANEWMSAIVDSYKSFLSRQESQRICVESPNEEECENADPFESLRLQWSQAVVMLQAGDWLKDQLQSDLIRTQENETSFYGCLAIQRAAAAAETALAPYTNSSGSHGVVTKRTSEQDDALRQIVDEKVSALVDPIQLKRISTWREESVVRLLRKVQSRRLDRRFASENGCSRCDSIKSPVKALNLDFANPGRGKRKGEGDLPRVDSSRMLLTTGLGSKNTCAAIEERLESNEAESEDSITNVCVSVRGSKIHGWGLFADQPFRKGDVVAEYIGEYVTNPVADAREKVYQEQRVQDYQFRLDDLFVIDATLKGGNGRYINHNCSPNSYAKTIPGKVPKPHLKRVVMIALRDIDINEEITYDYQFPLEMNLSNRIPCNCQSDACRGFMNWDIPEKGSNNRALLIQKRGANMRDRIRRLGRPLKRDE